MNKNNENEGKDIGDVEVQTDKVIIVEEKDVQTEKEKKNICKKEISGKEDKVFCILKTAKCTKEESKEYKNKVESEMDLEDLLENLGKVLVSGKRLNMN